MAILLVSVVLFLTYKYCSRMKQRWELENVQTAIPTAANPAYGQTGLVLREGTGSDDRETEHAYEYVDANPSGDIYIEVV